MEIWKNITKKTRELIEYKCDTCGEKMYAPIITLTFGYGHPLDELQCHFCKDSCVLKYIASEIKKQKPDNFIYGEKTQEDKNA
jgi:hypothetical protein